MQRFKKGDRVIHAKFGLGTVVTNEEDGVITIDFNQYGKKTLSLQYASLQLATPTDDIFKPGGEAYNEWLETFEFEDESVKHFLGSHWEPFYNEPVDILKQIADILPKSLVQIAFSDNRPGHWQCPTEWQKAVYLVWPFRICGLASAVRIMPDALNEVVSCFPFYAEGIQHRLVIDKVYVWKSGVEGQIKASFGDATITFFDTLYAANRSWYKSGDAYQFILVGIAYNCRKAEDQIIEIDNIEVVKAIQKTLTENEVKIIDNKIPIHTKGMAVFLPVQEWDRDDYYFRGQIKAVKEIEILNQTAWKATVTVIRQVSDKSDCDLDIIVTRKIWHDGNLPKVGDDIEGRLWLQGYLWYPERIVKTVW